jgi:hypothetical protein
MPRGPDNDPLFETVDRDALRDVAAWGVEGGDYSDDDRYRWSGGDGPGCAVE